MLSVRRAGSADVADWARLRVALMLTEGLVEEGPAAEALQRSIEAWLRVRLDSPSFAAFVAALDGRVAGSGGISLYDHPPGPREWTREGYVMSMYTEREARGRGVGSAVLSAMLDFARAAGVDRVWLRATPLGRSVYVRAGFQPRDSYLELHLASSRR